MGLHRLVFFVDAASDLVSLRQVGLTLTSIVYVGRLVNEDGCSLPIVWEILLLVHCPSKPRQELCARSNGLVGAAEQQPVG